MPSSIHFFSSLLKASWQGAILIVLVLVLQFALGTRLKSAWRCGLWLLVMLRLALPWTVPSQISLFNFLNLPALSRAFIKPQAARSAAAFDASEKANSPRLEPADRSMRQPPRWAGQSGRNVTALLAVWLSGVLALSTYVLLTHYRLSKKIGRQRPLIDGAVMNLLEDCKQQMGVGAPVVVVEMEEVGSPSLFGFIRPRLVLPAGLTRSFSLEELRYVFLHELGHIRRRDILTGWLMAGLQILHWFNPMVWLAFYRMRLDRELACDALALSHGREQDNQQYGDTIIKLLENFGRPAWAPSLAGAAENRNQLKERIRMIAKFKRTNHQLAPAALLFAALGLTTLTDAQSGASKDKGLIGTWILVGSPELVGQAPAAGGRFKVITERTWSVTQTNPQTGVTNYHHGGTYTFKGKDYTEHVEYANESTKNLVGNVSKFTLELQGDTFNLIGINNSWKEVWKRVEADAAKPAKAGTTPLQGTWRGKEIHGKPDGISSLTIQGDTIEFHAANTNEWYKAAFSVYETTPKQIVAVVTDCPFPEYRGMTSYAIYEVQNGTLTLSGNEPGFPAPPAGFDAPGSRKLVLKQE